jgi:UDP-glucose:(heptosyl)LPS alpha-1,3-glucosyltransferase
LERWEGRDDLDVGLVILHADATRGGAERYTLDLARALTARGHAVTLLAASFGETPSGARQVALGARGRTRAGQLGAFLDSLDAHLDQRRYDVVHAMLPVRRCDIYQPHAGIAADNLRHGHLKYPDRTRRALAWLGNRLNRRRKLLSAVERRLLTGDSPPILICSSEVQQQVALAHYPLREIHLARLFNAVELEELDPTARPEARAAMRARLAVRQEQVLGLLIARDWVRKGVRQAIQAAARVHDPRLVLAIVGQEEPGRYRALARALRVETQVQFFGWAPDLYSFYRAADFFVLPTRADTCSLVVLQALAMGLPVISTRQNGACEIMTDGRHGVVLPDPQNIDALSHAMRGMLDTATRERMAAAALELRSELAYETHLARMLEIYEQAARERAGVARAR